MKPTGPTNIQLRKLVNELGKREEKIWRAAAISLARPTRIRRAVNLSKISRYAKAGETILVPGKVLSAGVLDKKLTVCAWQFSKNAEQKIKAAGGHAVTINQLMEKNPKGNKVRIIG